MDYFTLSDDELTDLLRPMDDLNKWVFLDACKSGGFVGNGEDLEQLNNLHFMASAPENGYMHYAEFGNTRIFDGTGTPLDGFILPDGLPAFGLVLADGFGLDEEGTLKADRDGDGSITFEELSDWMMRRDMFYTKNNGELIDVLSLVQLYEGEFGDLVEYSSDIYSPTFYKSVDANGDLFESPAPVPEPSTLLLLGSGLAGLGWYGRKRKKA